MRSKLLGSLLSLIVLAGCGGTTIKQLVDAEFRGESGQCRTNLRGLNSAFLIYGTDYDDQFPLANWHETLQPYLQAHPEYQSCPSLHSPDHSMSGYALNTALIGQSRDLINQPIISFFETSTLTPGTSADPASRLTESRHEGTIFRAYLDGYIENTGAKQ